MSPVQGTSPLFPFSSLLSLSRPTSLSLFLFQPLSPLPLSLSLSLSLPAPLPSYTPFHSHPLHSTPLGSLLVFLSTLSSPSFLLFPFLLSTGGPIPSLTVGTLETCGTKVKKLQGLRCDTPAALGNTCGRLVNPCERWRTQKQQHVVNSRIPGLPLKREPFCGAFGNIREVMFQNGHFGTWAQEM